MLAKAYTNSYSDKQNKSYLVEDINWNNKIVTNFILGTQIKYKKNKI